MENARGSTVGSGVDVPRGLNAAATLVVSAAAVGIVVWSDRALDRWWAANHPLAGAKERIEGARTTYLKKRENLAEMALLIGAVVFEVSRATAMRQRAPRTTSPPS